ncbi:hypothetical protein SAMN05660297_03105 [Natronincola peptidivorans]|uniref:Uncharacterized protein n=1 Tax=Natronincola peptidivorans TaxID=426128 RepID=A0A1I0G9I1_9FIRM|nr:hypothetical protein [Natronincola peptidivorans]SET67405.1 hypothetical protein SAMN05660297_03105 [Natronincola peptidivorans]
MTKNLSLRSLYLYLVCLVTLVIFIFGTIFTIHRVVDLLIEDAHYYQTLEDFQQRFVVYGPDRERQEPQLSQEEIEKRYEAYLEQENARRKARNIRDLSYSSAAMIVGGGFWFYHWKKIKED